ncbi:protein phosphatase 1 regulatory subunit 3E-like [Amphiura filiformis]|uniref:protein phosphatase 1 regulatory subunit 3E-like n=1 Tax=Amphiura filiformis TaxID=82378 RepID=UPI003B20E6EB
MQGDLQTLTHCFENLLQPNRSNNTTVSRFTNGTMQRPDDIANDIGDDAVDIPKRSTSQETLSDDEYFDCPDWANLSPSSFKEFLRKAGAPKELPNNESSSEECSIGESCGLCSKLKIPPRDTSACMNNSASGFLSPEDSLSCESGSPLGSVTPQSPTSPVVSPADSGSSTPRRRKPSLKSPNAPDTPRRKSVRFADALGLDLETVKHILENETSPDYPSIAFGASSQDGNSVTLLPRYLALNFQQPGGQHDFITRVHKHHVCLENAVVSDFTILGTVKVRNITYHKSVKIRYSCDGWRTFGDVPASYVHGSCDGPMDRFSFGLSAPRELDVGGTMEFCVCYKAGNTEYWDNNFGHNYVIECSAQVETLTDDCQKFWTHFL